MSESWFPTKLVEIWELNGKRTQFDMMRKEWPENYLDWMILTGKVVPTMLKAWSNQDSKDEDGRFSFITVRFTPLGLKLMRELGEGLKMMREGPKTHRRQITIEGKEIDLRNRANFDIAVAGIKEVEGVAQSYLTQLRNRPNKRVRRRLKCELQRVLLMRGPELNRWLYGSVCLWTGAGMPPDFFTSTPPEGLPKLQCGDM